MTCTRAICLGSALLIAALALADCGKSGPCSGGGMAVDERPLPADWAALASPPAGAVACHQADGAIDQEYARSYELGSNPQEAFEQWRAHLTSTGWTPGANTSSERGLDRVFEREGATIQVYVSLDVTDKGWSTVTFQPRLR